MVRPKPKENVQLLWISLFSKSSWIKTTACGLFYELGWSDKKKVNENWDIINKNGHSIFHTVKAGNFNSLRDIIWIILCTVTLKSTEDESKCQRSVMIINLFQIMCIGHVLEAPGL